MGIKPCNRCKRRHVGVIMIPNDGWLLIFATEWEERCSEFDPDYNFLEIQAREQARIFKAPSNSMRVTVEQFIRYS